MGWVLQEDRGLLLAQARDAAQLAALDAPGVYAFGLVINLRQYTPTKQVDRIIEREAPRALRRRARGRALLHDIDVYLQGINARLKAEGGVQSRGPASTSSRATRSSARSSARAAATRCGARSSCPAAQALRDGEGQGDLRRPLGARRPGLARDDEPRRSRYGKAIGVGHGTPWSTTARRADGPEGPGDAPRAEPRIELPDGGARTLAIGHPLFVAGPQIGYIYPGLTLEIDLKGPGVEARGATVPGFAGNILSGAARITRGR